ncbi:MAG: hypothetical protein N2C14_26570, partial [Planctomycetales bacterium]
MPLDVDVNKYSDVYFKLLQIAKPPAKAFPTVWIIRADGEVMYVENSLPEPRAQFLRQHAGKAGIAISPSQAEEVEKAITRAEELKNSGDLAGAALAVVR